LAVWQDETGHKTAAAQTIDEAASLHTQLVARDPRQYTLDHAMTLNVQAVVLNHVEQHEQACDAARRAVTGFREIPEGQTYLSTALHQYAMLLAHVGQLTEAHQRHQEAVAMLRSDPGQQDSLHAIQQDWANTLHELDMP
jgi:tetratricopeptide (TPR) repeat protein